MRTQLTPGRRACRGRSAGRGSCRSPSCSGTGSRLPGPRWSEAEVVEEEAAEVADGRRRWRRGWHRRRWWRRRRVEVEVEGRWRECNFSCICGSAEASSRRRRPRCGRGAPSSGGRSRSACYLPGALDSAPRRSAASARSCSRSGTHCRSGSRRRAPGHGGRHALVPASGRGPSRHTTGLPWRRRASRKKASSRVPATAVEVATTRPAKIASSSVKIERVAAGSMLLSSGLRAVARDHSTKCPSDEGHSNAVLS